MPTGYTEKLYDGEQGFKDFTLRAAHAFLGSMHDMSLDSAIPERFVPSSYFNDAYEKAKEECSVLLTATPEQLKERVEAEYSEFIETQAKEEAENKARRQRYEKMLAEVKDWVPPTDEHVGLRDFMVHQLEQSIDYDCIDYHREPPTRDVAEWKTERVDKLLRDMSYYREQIDKENKRLAQQTKWVYDLRASFG